MRSCAPRNGRRDHAGVCSSSRLSAARTAATCGGRPGNRALAGTLGPISRQTGSTRLPSARGAQFRAPPYQVAETRCAPACKATRECRHVHTHQGYAHYARERVRVRDDLCARPGRCRLLTRPSTRATVDGEAHWLEVGPYASQAIARRSTSRRAISTRCVVDQNSAGR
jgi:hypothetical protein